MKRGHWRQVGDAEFRKADAQERVRKLRRKNPTRKYHIATYREGGSRVYIVETWIAG